MSILYTRTKVDQLFAALAAVASTGAYGSLTGRPTIPASASDIGAAPMAVASGANALRFVGYGSALPASGTVGDCFFLQAP